MSWQQTLLNGLMRVTMKRHLTRVSDPASARRDIARSADWVFRRPPRICALGVDLGGGLGALSVRAGVPRRPGQLVLFLHGGGYNAGSPRVYLALCARLSRLTRTEVIAPAYRLAPEAPFPAAFDDALAAWQALRARGYRAEDIVLAGDSAGGGLALALLARLCAAGTPPAGLVAFSPWTDLGGSGASLQENRRHDPMLPSERLPEVAQFYLQGQPATDPRASPLHAAFPGCPPVHLQCSQTEILRDDTLRMADRLRAFGAAVTVQVWPAAPHVWQVFDGWIPEARAALSDAAAAITAMLSRSRN